MSNLGHRNFSVHSPQLQGIEDLNPESLCVLVLHIETSQVRHLQTTETCAGLGLWLVTLCHPGLWLADAPLGGDEVTLPAKLLSQVSSGRSCLPCYYRLMWDIMSRAERGEERRGEWRRRQYKVHHYWLLCPCCASFRFLSGLVVTDSFVSEYSAHVTCVSFVAQSVLLPNWNVSLRTLTQQFVKFEFNMTLNCIHICGQTVKAFSYG